MNNEKIGTLKDYYINIERMYSNAVNMLTAINQSLSSSASQITVNIMDNDDVAQTVRIPSFIYLENKLEELSNNFSNLIHMPESGDAWLNYSNSAYKIELVKSNVSPQTPSIKSQSVFAYSKDNNFLKDLVNPKTYLKFDISNVTSYSSKFYVKKVVFYKKEIFDNLKSKYEGTDITIELFNAEVFNLSKGVDYNEYEFCIEQPIKYDKYKSKFEIAEVIDTIYPDYDNNSKITYKVRFDTNVYTQNEDSSIEYELKIGDILSLDSSSTLYKITDITLDNDSSSDEESYVVLMEEYIGHSALQNFEENQNMILRLYDSTNFSSFNYIEIPLEENPYIGIFFSTLNNNIRSYWSNLYLYDLNSIYMKDANNNYLYDQNSTVPFTYIEYYNKYCKNIGDLIDSLTLTAYPQLANFTTEELEVLQNSDIVKSYVSNSLNKEDQLVVTRINNHLLDNESNDQIKNLHKQKTEINTKLTNIESNIDVLYNQLLNIDTSSDDSVINKNDIKQKLDDAYSERLLEQKQLIGIIDDISNLNKEVSDSLSSKYRIRGVLDVSEFESYLTDNYDVHVDIIGMDVEYRYKATNSKVSNVASINNNVFSDWNKLQTKDRERKLYFNSQLNNWYLDFANYDGVANIIKWNQVDIPINLGEDVVIRVRYKYSVGQPFVNMYSPWSDELTVVFPSELSSVDEVTDILAQNETDVDSAKFTKSLINGGYTEHVTNKMVDGSQVFYHMPENIYSGFNTAENNLISLKDKLYSLNNELNEYKNFVVNESKINYKIYLEIDGKLNELFDNKTNSITIKNESSTHTTSFTKKSINILIKNNSDNTLNLYSLFPGNQNVLLKDCSNSNFVQKISSYASVPLLIGNSNIFENNINIQSMGQFLYFRNSNIFNNNTFYIPYSSNIKYDNYMSTSKQLSLDVTKTLELKFNSNDKTGTLYVKDDSLSTELYSWKNDVLLAYEQLSTTVDDSEDSDEQTIYYANEMSDLSEFATTDTALNRLLGAFFIPELETREQLLCTESNIDTNYYPLASGDTITIPLAFEYFLNAQQTLNSVTKTLAFDLRPSLIKEVKSYIINLTIENNVFRETESPSYNNESIEDII